MFVNEEGSIQAVATSVAKTGITQTGVFVGAGTIQAGKWYNFAAVISADDNFFNLYLNGDLIGTHLFRFVGHSRHRAARCGLAMPIIRCGDRSTTTACGTRRSAQQEVRDIMHTAPPLNAPGLMGLLAARRRGTATTFADATANDNDGYLHGALPGWPGALGGRGSRQYGSAVRRRADRGYDSAAQHGDRHEQYGLVLDELGWHRRVMPIGFTTLRPVA